MFMIGVFMIASGAVGRLTGWALVWAFVWFHWTVFEIAVGVASVG